MAKTKVNLKTTFVDPATKRKRTSIIHPFAGRVYHNKEYVIRIIETKTGSMGRVVRKLTLDEKKLLYPHMYEGSKPWVAPSTKATYKLENTLLEKIADLPNKSRFINDAIREKLNRDAIKETVRETMSRDTEGE